LETQTTRIYWNKTEIVGLEEDSILILTRNEVNNKCEAEELFYDLLNNIKVADKKNLVEVLNFAKFHIDKWIDENQLREEVK